jgi:hypothetical protein
MFVLKIVSNVFNFRKVQIAKYLQLLEHQGPRAAAKFSKVFFGSIVVQPRPVSLWSRLKQSFKNFMTKLLFLRRQRRRKPEHQFYKATTAFQVY